MVSTFSSVYSQLKNLHDHLLSLGCLCVETRDLDVLVDELRLLSFHALSTVWTVGACARVPSHLGVSTILIECAEAEWILIRLLVVSCLL